jgi:hypothetical protein
MKSLTKLSIPGTTPMLVIMIVLGVALVGSCSQQEDTAQQAADKRQQAEADCARIARDKTGYSSSAQSSTSSIGKGAAIGAATGAAVGALSSDNNNSNKNNKGSKNNKKNKKSSSNDTTTKVVQGAVVGAAAGAGIGALSDNEKKKAAAQSREAYQREYQNCLRDKDF